MTLHYSGDMMHTFLDTALTQCNGSILVHDVDNEKIAMLYKLSVLVTPSPLPNLSSMDST